MSAETFLIEESDRQLILLAIARLGVERPGWQMTLHRLASEVLHGEDMFAMFQRFKRQEVGIAEPEDTGKSSADDGIRPPG